MPVSQLLPMHQDKFEDKIQTYLELLVKEMHHT